MMTAIQSFLVKCLVGGDHDVTQLFLSLRDKSKLASGSSSIKSACVNITPCCLNNLLPLWIRLQGGKKIAAPFLTSTAKSQKLQLFGTFIVLHLASQYQSTEDTSLTVFVLV